MQAMKVLQIVPRDGRKFYNSVVRSRTTSAGTAAGPSAAAGPQTAQCGPLGACEIHRLGRSGAHAENLVTAKIKSRNKADESKLCTAFLGWVDRHFGDDLASVTIQYH